MLGQLILANTFLGFQNCGVAISEGKSLDAIAFIFRFKSDPNIPGTEKLAVAEIRAELMPANFPKITLQEVTDAPGLLGPMSVFLVKGWSRCVSAVACLLHAYESPEAFQARCQFLQISLLIRVLLLLMSQPQKTIQPKIQVWPDALKKLLV